MAAHQAPLSLGFSRQEHWSGLPLPSPMHESEKWKWSHSVVSDSSRLHGLQPTRLLHPWGFPGKSTGVGCHCLLHHTDINNWINKWGRDFPGGPVVKNLPANVADTFDPWYGKTPHARKQRDPCATPTEPAAYSWCSATWEKPPQWGAHTPQQRVATTHCN